MNGNPDFQIRFSEGLSIPTDGSPARRVHTATLYERNPHTRRWRQQRFHGKVPMLVSDSPAAALREIAEVVEAGGWDKVPGWMHMVSASRPAAQP